MSVRSERPLPVLAEDRQRDDEGGERVDVGTYWLLWPM
jgi:hypothetical protein